MTLKGQRELLRPVSPEIRGEQISLGESPRQEAPAPARPVAAKEALRPMTMPSLTPPAPKPEIKAKPVFPSEMLQDSSRSPYRAVPLTSPASSETAPAPEYFPAEQPTVPPQEEPPVWPQPAEAAAPPVPEEAPAAPEPEKAPPAPPARLIGEAFGTYLLLQQGDGQLVVIDKHAAHERLLYEKLRKEGGGAEAQMLLEPAAVTLDKNEYAAVLGAKELFAQAGFEVEDFGGGTVLVRSAPLSLDREDAASAVMEMAGYLLSSRRDLTTEHLDWLYHNIACRAAVKAGDFSSPQELEALARQLRENPDVRYCPHGRPVSVVITRRELEKQFGRV